MKFQLGNAGGPGRPPKAKEKAYLKALSEVVTIEEWCLMAKRALEDAKQGNGHARNWISKHLVGEEPLLLLETIEEQERQRVEIEELKRARGTPGSATEDDSESGGPPDPTASEPSQ